jgi:bacterioferritin (cytochrome b1)
MRKPDREDPLPRRHSGCDQIKGYPYRDGRSLQLKNDHHAEEDAIKAYNSAIVAAEEAKDHATKDILQGILNEETRTWTA